MAKKHWMAKRSITTKHQDTIDFEKRLKAEARRARAAAKKAN